MCACHSYIAEGTRHVMNRQIFDELDLLVIKHSGDSVLCLDACVL